LLGAYAQVKQDLKRAGLKRSPSFQEVRAALVQQNPMQRIPKLQVLKKRFLLLNFLVRKGLLSGAELRFSPPSNTRSRLVYRLYCSLKVKLKRNPTHRELLVCAREAGLKTGQKEMSHSALSSLIYKINKEPKKYLGNSSARISLDASARHVFPDAAIQDAHAAYLAAHGIAPTARELREGSFERAGRIVSKEHFTKRVRRISQAPHFVFPTRVQQLGHALRSGFAELQKAHARAPSVSQMINLLERHKLGISTEEIRIIGRVLKYKARGQGQAVTLSFHDEAQKDARLMRDILLAYTMFRQKNAGAFPGIDELQAACTQYSQQEIFQAIRSLNKQNKDLGRSLLYLAGNEITDCLIACKSLSMRLRQMRKEQKSFQLEKLSKELLEKLVRASHLGAEYGLPKIPVHDEVGSKNVVALQLLLVRYRTLCMLLHVGKIEIAKKDLEEIRATEKEAGARFRYKHPAEYKDIFAGTNVLLSAAASLGFFKAREGREIWERACRSSNLRQALRVLYGPFESLLRKTGA
jgi:hypothetical protein